MVHGGGTDDYPVELGNYQVIGEFYLPCKDNQYVPVSVPIQIIPEPAMIYYVDADATGANNGSSWTDAYNYLQDALTVSSSGDEIWVAQGIYKPDQGAGVTPGDRTATFQLINGMAIGGGYAGFGEPDPNVRNIELYETILSGDLAGNDVEVNDPRDLWNEPTRAENSHHVVTGSGTDETSAIDGFSMTGGHFYAVQASSSGVWGGGGIYNVSGSPTVLNCSFSGNYNISSGGGMLNYNNSNPTLVHCVFSGNFAGSGGGMFGGSPIVTNCTFSGNSAYYGGALYCCSGLIINCILWGNADSSGADESAQIQGGTPVINYCCIQGWTGTLRGIANINIDPRFVDPNDGDYHLKSAGWRWDRERRRWHYDEVTSPCIDTGNPGSPLRDEPLTIPDDPNNEWGENLRINMGAYGGTAVASMALPGWALLADLNNDAIVNFVDFALQAQDWQMIENEQPGDLNRNGDVNMIDVAILAEDWLKQKPFVVSITKPQNGAEFDNYETIEIEVDAWCIGGSIVKVQFFANESKIGEDNDGTDGWKFSWRGEHEVGNYNLTAKATSDDGAIAVLLAVSIYVLK